MRTTTLGTAKNNPVPKKSLALMVVMGSLLFAPRLIEGTSTTCDAVSAHAVDAIVEQVPQSEVTNVSALRRLIAGKIAPTLVGVPWYQCSTLYWVNIANPPPPMTP